MTSQAQPPITAQQTISWCHPIGTRDGTLTKDAKMVNVFSELTENGRALVKRPGTAAVLAQTGPAAQGGFNCDGYAYYITGDRIYSIDGTFSAAIPSVTVPNDVYYTLSDVPSDTVHGTSWLKSSWGLWQFVANVGSVGGTVTKVTDANYPEKTVPGIVNLDGIYYVMDITGNVRGSALDDGTTWPALNFIQADASFGVGLQISRHLNFIVAYYAKGIQLYYDANAANGQVTQGTQLGPVTNASWTTGIAAGSSAVELSDIQYFTGRDKTKGVVAAQLNGLELEIISTPYIEKILSRSNTLNMRSFGLRIGGHGFYGLTLLDLGITLVYDTTMKEWQQWTSIVNNVEQFFVGVNYINGEGLDLFQNYLDGSVFKMDPTLYTDVTGPLKATSVTPIYDYGTINWKRVASAFFLGDIINTSITVSVSDDDYTTWQNPKVISLNTVKKMIQRGGRFRRRAYTMVHEDNTPLRLLDPRFDLTVLNS